MTAIQTNEIYESLVDEIRYTHIQNLKNIGWDVVKMWAMVGKVVVDNELYHKHSKGNQEFLARLFDDAEIGKTNGYYAVKLYEEYFVAKQIKDIPQGVERLAQEEFLALGDGVSWKKVKDEISKTTPIEYQSKTKVLTELDKVIRLIEKLPVEDLLIVKERVDYFIQDKVDFTEKEKK